MFSISACSNINKYPIQGKFLFESSRSGNSIDLYMSKNEKVMLIAKKAYYPKWSPDGRLIACVVEKQFDKIKKKGVLLIDEKGQTKDFFEIELSPSLVQWSPDGKKIYFVCQRADKPIYADGIYILDLVSRDYAKIWGPNYDAHIDALAVSPTGDKVLFEKEEPKLGVYVLDLMTKDVKYLINGVNAAWFPDGKHIVYTTNIDEDGNTIDQNFLGYFFRMNTETGEKEKVRKERHLMTLSLKVSKDGKYFYYTIQGAGGGQQIVVSPIDNEKIEIPVTQPIMTSSGFSQDHSPDWYQGD